MFAASRRTVDVSPPLVASPKATDSSEWRANGASIQEGLLPGDGEQQKPQPCSQELRRTERRKLARCQVDQSVALVAAQGQSHRDTIKRWRAVEETHGGQVNRSRPSKPRAAKVEALVSTPLQVRHSNPGS